MIKKIMCTVLAVVFAVGSLAGCQDSTKSDKINIVCTIFPEYDWITSIIGEKSDKFNVTMLLDSGADLHSYQPTADDMVKISSCDVFIYVGGNSDKWAADALKDAVNKDMIVVDLLDVLGKTAKEEEVKEGMQADDEDEESGIEYDEHIWLSLKNASTLCSAIEKAISKVDYANKSTYEDNAKAYTDKLNELDGEYQLVVDNASTKTLLFGDRFPFRYMIEDYKLDYYAAFVGCSAESEASFETITFLAKKVDELGLKNVCVIENSDKKIAKTIISNTTTKNQSVVAFDSMQSITSKEVNKGTRYIDIMKNNLESLKKALS